MSFCPHCQAELRDTGAAECPNCGAALGPGRARAAATGAGQQVSPGEKSDVPRPVKPLARRGVRAMLRKIADLSRGVDQAGEAASPPAADNQAHDSAEYQTQPIFIDDTAPQGSVESTPPESPLVLPDDADSPRELTESDFTIALVDDDSANATDAGPIPPVAPANARADDADPAHEITRSDLTFAIDEGTPTNPISAAANRLNCR
jgi:hypothetical protein